MTAKGKPRGFVHESSRNETKEWYTPKHIFDALGLEFDLDPCSPEAGRGHVPARNVYTKQDDGLIQPWSGRVWLNPPYGQETPIWLRKLAEHGHGIALVFARTDTRWFHEVAPQADAICFVSGRVQFLTPAGLPGGQPGSGSVLMAYGPDCAAALERCGLGFVVNPKTIQGAA